MIAWNFPFAIYRVDQWGGNKSVTKNPFSPAKTTPTIARFRHEYKIDPLYLLI